MLINKETQEPVLLENIDTDVGRVVSRDTII